jgi:ATP-dependent DNA helicase RecG
MDRSGIKQEPGLKLQVKNHLAQKIRALLPYKPTQAQERSIAEVLSDLQEPIAMNRILQGDVGAGKTLVALMVAAEAAENNWQTAILAPTEILAEQHFQQAEKILSPVGIKVGFLSGSLKKSAKLTAQEKNKKRRVASGDWNARNYSRSSRVEKFSLSDNRRTTSLWRKAADLS